MSDYPMLISNKLHSFRNFTIQKYEQFPNIHSSKKDVRVFSPHILIFFYFAKRLSLNRLR